MKQRIITGAVFGVLVLVVLFLSHTVVYPAVMTVLCIIGTAEMLRCIGTFKNAYLSLPSLLFAAAFPVLSFGYRYGVLAAAAFAYLVLLLIMSVIFNEKINVQGVCSTFAMVLYIAVCFSSLIKLRYVTTEVGGSGGENIGKYIYLLVFIAAWITDTFAYFTGFFFGKHKLCPKISPKKTIEGSVGGTLFCVIAFLIYGFALSLLFDFSPNYPGLAVVGILMSVLAQLGDLLASVIKRTYGIKDYGKLFPGHGGVLDRFDSVLLLAPMLLVLVEDAQFVQILFIM